MPFILLLVGAVFIVAAYNDAQGTLISELETDIPPFLKWALAIVGVGAIGWIPGMQTIGRWLLALVLVVLFLSNYSQIIAGFQAMTGAEGAQANAPGVSPAQAYAQNPTNPQITTAEVTGTGQVSGTASSSAQAVNINANAQPAMVTSPYGAFDPSNFLQGFEAGFGGFGGIA